MRHEAVIARIGHRRIEKPVDHQGPGLLVQFVLDWLPADRDFDDDVDIFGRVFPDGELFDALDS